MPHQSLADMLIADELAVAATPSISSESALSPLASTDGEQAAANEGNHVLCSVDGVTTVLPYPVQPALDTEGEVR